MAKKNTYTLDEALALLSDDFESLKDKGFSWIRQYAPCWLRVNIKLIESVIKHIETGSPIRLEEETKE